MKKAGIILAALVSAVLLFTGCGNPFGKEQEQTFKVYSFSGENDDISLTNGVLVLADEEEICYGGNLKVNDDITAYSVTIYLSIGDEKEVLMSGTTEAVTGETIDTPDDLGKIYGDIIENDRIDKLSGTLNDNLWMEVETTDLDGEIETYQLQLNVTEITENIAR